MTHPLESWIAAQGMSLQAFSKESGVSPASLLRLVKGKADVSTVMIRKVSDATGGEVTEKQLFNAWVDARRRRSLKTDGVLADRRS